MSRTQIKYIGLFLIIIVIIDVCFGLIIKNVFKDIKYSDYGTLNKNLKVDSEVLILGSSRAMHHYNSHEISKTLGKSTYNLGLGGNGLFYNYAILKEVLKESHPKIVLLDLSPNIIVDKNSYTKLNLLLPYYSHHDAFKEIIELNPKFSKLELVSNLYVYNSTLYDIIRSSNMVVSLDNKFGYKPLEGEMNLNNFAPFHLEDDEVMDDNKTKYLTKIIKLCKEKKIKLIGIISPTYLKFDRSNRIINKLDSILSNSQINLYNYSDYSEFYQNPFFFKDQLHLNKKGAIIFSNEIARNIKTELIK